MKIVHTEDVRSWYASGLSLSGFIRSIGRKKTDTEYLERTLGMPLHLAWGVEQSRKGDRSIY